MCDHRNSVRSVLEFLSFVTVRYDPNGLDIYFLNSQKGRKCKCSTDIVGAFDGNTGYKYGDMEHRFSDIIDKYRQQFDETHKLRRLWDKNQPRRGPRKLSLYVLTDGASFVDCDLEPVFRDLVQHVRRCDFSHTQVGVQFIRFGNHERGRECLQALDDDLKAKIDL